jgi:hypothetical protein
MLSWPPTVKIFLCRNATDMRKGFDSLAYLVESSMSLDPLSGHLFVKGVLPRSDLREQGDRILITPFDKAVVPALVWALNEARLNAYALNPSTVSVSVPPISEEERAEIARYVEKLGEDAKVAIRAIRQEARQRIEVSGRESQRSVRCSLVQPLSGSKVIEAPSPGRALRSGNRSGGELLLRLRSPQHFKSLNGRLRPGGVGELLHDLLVVAGRRVSVPPPLRTRTVLSAGSAGRWMSRRGQRLVSGSRRGPFSIRFTSPGARWSRPA